MTAEELYDRITFELLVEFNLEARGIFVMINQVVDHFVESREARTIEFFACVSIDGGISCGPRRQYLVKDATADEVFGRFRSETIPALRAHLASLRTSLAPEVSHA